MKFARLGEEIFERHDELTGEELRLYAIILFHTWSDTGICRKNLYELSKMHGLSYNHTTERYKKLRKIGWCRNTKKGIRPLVGVRTSKNGVLEDEKLQKTELPNSKKRSAKLQISEYNTPKNGVLEDEKLQKTEFALKEYTEPLKSESFSHSPAAEKEAAATAENNGHLSKFSMEECVRYVESCIERGERITNPHGLATSAYKSGKMDAFIRAVLYPETSQTEQSDSASEFDRPRPMGDVQKAEALEVLRDISALGGDISEWEQHYTAEDWKFLMEELKSAGNP